MLPLAFYQTRILDLTTSLAGAYATRFFADGGAEVFKIEAPQQPDALRNDDHVFESLARNKLSLALDVSMPGGRDLVLRLAHVADYAFIDADDQRFRPDELAAGNENLMLVVIDADAGSPAETGIAAAAGALTALFHRRQVGVAQRVDVDGRRVQGSLRFLASDARPRDIEALTADPQLTQSGFFETVGRRGGDFVRVDGLPYRFSRTPAHVRLPAPRLGEHTELVLRRHLNLTDDDLARLKSQGVISNQG